VLLSTVLAVAFFRTRIVATSEQTHLMVLTFLPLWLSGALLVGIPTLLAMAGPVLIRRRLSLERVRANNEVAGFKFATVGVLYAVLLAFAVIVVWEKFGDAENHVAEEAGAAATIYRLSAGIGGEAGAQLRSAMDTYLSSAIAEDWPAMAKGEPSAMTTRALDAAYTTLLSFTPTDPRGVALLTENLRQLDVVTQARRARLVVAAGVVPGIVWFVLFGGAIVTVGFTFFFATDNLRAQTLMTGALTALIFSGLLVIVIIDRPFAGTVKVTPEALSLVLHDFSSAVLNGHPAHG
jgi:hypothetical protein